MPLLSSRTRIPLLYSINTYVFYPHTKISRIIFCSHSTLACCMHLPKITITQTTHRRHLQFYYDLYMVLLNCRSRFTCRAFSLLRPEYFGRVLTSLREGFLCIAFNIPHSNYVNQTGDIQKTNLSNNSKRFTILYLYLAVFSISTINTFFKNCRSLSYPDFFVKKQARWGGGEGGGEKKAG